MSDTTVNGAFQHAKRVPKVEFFAYFALILAIASVLHVPGWIWQTVRHASLPRLSPLGRAWKDAQAVTPMIFRG